MGVYANIIAFFYDIFLITFLAFPPAPTVTVESMNWGPVIFLGSTILALMFYAVVGRHQFRDPGKEVVG